jgi:hypothetical protein
MSKINKLSCTEFRPVGKKNPLPNEKSNYGLSNQPEGVGYLSLVTRKNQSIERVLVTSCWLLGRIEA